MQPEAASIWKINYNKTFETTLLYEINLDNYNILITLYSHNFNTELQLYKKYFLIYIYFTHLEFQFVI